MPMHAPFANRAGPRISTCATVCPTPPRNQNLVRFSACPPAILVHLLRQPFVRRQQHLKNMILQHANVPSEAKRNL
jgi:hypothetical protein